MKVPFGEMPVVIRDFGISILLQKVIVSVPTTHQKPKTSF